ncbi:MAG TPA: Spy/CpxP family protein refolding chaperone [Pyrinomonadaceae bacterium]|nr:Spy/CpxP family protein refolding chaperone [Pyrinomonadaceae bacterium]HMP64535.1 Spy/CpxP family protein refolding chaperone [Pyrinomonadaceae bacterium]
MSYMKKIITFSAAAFLAGTFAVTGSAQTTERGDKAEKRAERPAGKGMQRGGFGRGLRGFRGGVLRRHGGLGLRGIDLTDAQKVQINAIREANRPDEGLREEMRSIMQSRRMGTLTEAQQERAKAIREIQRAKAENVRAQIEAVLTPEQKQTLEDRRKVMQERMEQRRQQMMERRQQWQQRRQSGEKPVEN